MTNGQLSLEQSAKRLADTVLSILKTLDLDEDSSERDRPRRLQRDRAAFRFLFDQISLFALNKLADEWEPVKKIATNQEDLGMKPCHCELLLRWYLPCKHHLFSIVKSGQPIPKSLVHPRWWIKGPAIQFSGWVPANQEGSEAGMRQADYLSPRGRQHTSVGQHLLVLRDAREDTDRAQLDDEIVRNDERILGLALNAYEGRGIPISNPLAIPKRKWLPRKIH